MKNVLAAISIITLCSCVSTNNIPIPSGPQTLNSVIYKPEGQGPFPTVILMHGCAGLDKFTSRGLRTHANFLVENGYAALILDSFSSRKKSGGKVCRSKTELANAMYYRRLDSFNALKHLQSLPYVDKNNLFLMGQSNGGAVALRAADADQYPNDAGISKFNAIVAFYPWCGALPRKLGTPLLILGGAKDNWTPIGRCLFAAENSDLGKEAFKVISYENAHHSFNLFIPTQTYLGYTLGGNSKARKDSKKQMLEWFQRFRI